LLCKERAVTVSELRWRLLAVWTWAAARHPSSPEPAQAAARTLTAHHHHDADRRPIADGIASSPRRARQRYDDDDGHASLSGIGSELLRLEVAQVNPVDVFLRGHLPADVSPFQIDAGARHLVQFLFGQLDIGLNGALGARPSSTTATDVLDLQLELPVLLDQGIVRVGVLPVLLVRHFGRSRLATEAIKRLK